jgi:hypothetical protein
VLVYFCAWLAPEPFFSKAFAAALTVRLSLLVGLVELGRVAVACLHLYREAEAATTPEELEAAAERFGKSIGGTALRVLVVVASLGLPTGVPCHGSDSGRRDPRRLGGGRGYFRGISLRRARDLRDDGW